jgi:ribosomal RNA-processing protein 8
MKPFIIEADIAHLPLGGEAVDLCVFCLSLMGTNYLSFIREAWRVLRQDGELIISEVESRSQSWRKFIELIEAVGFKLENNGLTLSTSRPDSQEARYFRTMLFRKAPQSSASGIKFQGKMYNPEQLSGQLLTSCKYKKR